MRERERKEIRNGPLDRSLQDAIHDFKQKSYRDFQLSTWMIMLICAINSGWTFKWIKDVRFYHYKSFIFLVLWISAGNERWRFKENISDFSRILYLYSAWSKSDQKKKRYKFGTDYACDIKLLQNKNNYT